MHRLSHWVGSGSGHGELEGMITLMANWGTFLDLAAFSGWDTGSALDGWARGNDFCVWDSYACLSTRVARMRYLRDGWMVCVWGGGVCMQNSLWARL